MEPSGHGAAGERIHRAGADFALSISQVSGQMLAKKLLGQESVAVDPQLKILKIAPDSRAGRNPAELALRERTGCSVVAVERGDEVIVDLGPGFRFQPEDAVYLCGSNNVSGGGRQFSPRPCDLPDPDAVTRLHTSSVRLSPPLGGKREGDQRTWQALGARRGRRAGCG